MIFEKRISKTVKLSTVKFKIRWRKHGDAFYHLFRYLLHFVPMPPIPPWEAFLYPHNRH